MADVMPCPTCGKRVTITAAGRIRAHARPNTGGRPLPAWARECEASRTDARAASGETPRG